MNDARAQPPLRIAFLFRNFGYVRLFDGLIRRLLDRGHRVHLIYERRPAAPTEVAWLDDLSDRPGFSSSYSDTIERDRWSALADFLRRVSDDLHARSPGFVGGPALVARSEIRVTPRVRRLLDCITRRSGSRSHLLALRVVTALERALPAGRLLTEEVRRLEADVLVLAPHLMPGSRHEEYVKSAHAAGVPVCMCIASWDNLTTKQRIRVLPERLVVWNPTQALEAETLHGVPRKIVTITGAQSFDEWFGREASGRDVFAARVGVDHDRPFVLFVAGALFPAARTEAEWVRDRWLPALRADARLRGVAVIVRPHPRRAEQWRSVSFADDPLVALWPTQTAPMPVDEETRRDFYDSIHHSAAVVGINTTAMIEAAAVGRPVLTVLEPEFAESQRETHHFNYLLEIAGGAVEAAESIDEHLVQLARAVGGDATANTRREGFLRAFVRPHGLNRPALPFVVDAIEVSAGIPVAISRPSPGQLLLRGVLRISIGVTRNARRLLHARPD